MSEAKEGNENTLRETASSKYLVGVNPFDSTTWDQQHTEYFNYIDHCLDEKDSGTLSNGTPLHTVFLLERFIRKAERRVKVVSRRLKRKSDDSSNQFLWAHESVIDAVELFLTKFDSKLEILLVDEVKGLDNHPLIERVQSLKDSGRLHGVFTIGKISDEDRSHLIPSEAEYPINFMIKDEDAIRVEMEHKKLKAFIEFGKSKFLKSMKSLFRSVSKKSTGLIDLRLEY